MNHPMQVKPASTESKLTPIGKAKQSPIILASNYPPPIAEERRLFVGMLCRDYNEDNVRAMFAPYGLVEDVSILRNDDGRSKGHH